MGYRSVAYVLWVAPFEQHAALRHSFANDALAVYASWRARLHRGVFERLTLLLHEQSLELFSSDIESGLGLFRRRFGFL